jgi:hypothetical protein
MSNRRKTAKLAPWIPMDRHQYKSAAFAALSAEAQALLVHLTYNYNTKMMNSVWISARDAAKKLNISRSSAARKLLELEHYGFIVKVRGAYLGVSGVGKSAQYRLTAQRYGNVGATHDYDKWDGEIFDQAPGGGRNWRPKKCSQKNFPVPQEGQCVPQEGHKGTLPGRSKMEQPSHRKDIRTPSDRPTGRTYLVLPSAELSAGETGEQQPPAHAPIGHNAGPPLEPAGLMEWTTPILTEIAYTAARRKLYCEADDDDFNRRSELVRQILEEQ